MTYDEKLAERIRSVLPVTTDITEKKMFGGLAFLLDGKMFVGIANKDLMVRVGPEAYETSLARRHVRPMDFTGRPLTGYVYVGPAGSRTADAVAKWVEHAVLFVRALPRPKTKPKNKKPPRTYRARRTARAR